MSSIFLSHSLADGPIARRIAADLRLAGHSVWIDQAEIELGDSLIEKIREGLDDVDFSRRLFRKNRLTANGSRANSILHPTGNCRKVVSLSCRCFSRAFRFPDSLKESSMQTSPTLTPVRMVLASY